MYSRLDEKLINKLIDYSKKRDSIFELMLDDKPIKLTNTIISKTKTPVKHATDRGGVYFSDTTTYKIIATTNNSKILERLKKTMLGPNDEFEDLKINVPGFRLICNLTNTMQNSEIIQLNMMIKDLMVSYNK